MTHVAVADIASLQAVMTGSVVDPGHPDYDEARRVWNGDVEGRPAVIARCADASDVARAIGFARRRSLEIAVRSGAHSASARATWEHGNWYHNAGCTQCRVDPRPARN